MKQLQMMNTFGLLQDASEDHQDHWLVYVVYQTQFQQFPVLVYPKKCQFSLGRAITGVDVDSPVVGAPRE